MFLILNLNSCINKEYNVNYNVFFCNQSGKNLSIEYYKNGIININQSIKNIKNNECRNVFSIVSRGSSPTYGSEIIDNDSAVIIFDDGRKLTHYGYFQKNGPNPKAYPNNHNRNIFGDGTGYKDNWVYTLVSETKNSKSEEMKYTFTEQDYLDAQK